MDVASVTSGIAERAGSDRPAGEAPAVLRQTAQAFEAAFLTEMLKHSGVARVPDQFGGGPGEAAFADLLTREYAREISRTGRIGIAEPVYRYLVARAAQ